MRRVKKCKNVENRERVGQTQKMRRPKKMKRRHWVLKWVRWFFEF